MKHCNSCNQDKELSEFGKDKYSKDGYTDYCKECRNAQARHRAKMKPAVYGRDNWKFKEYRKAYYNKPENKRKYKSQMLKQTYGITIEEYEALLEKQNNVCAICKQPELTVRNKNLAVDHCHKSGKIRGLLCSHCNRAIGLMKDDYKILREAANYLWSHK